MQNSFPLNLNPGEEYNLIIKVIKNAFLNEKTDVSENIYANEISLTEGSESNKVTENSTDIQLPENNPVSLVNQNQMNQVENTGTKLNANSIVVTRKTQLNSLSNIGSPLYTENSLGNQKKAQENKPNEDDEQNNLNTIIGDENIKIHFNTPVILCISSNMFYEDLFICLQIKWINEINRFLKIELSIPKNIQINDYFDVQVKVRNISSAPMNLFIELKENDTKLISNNKVSKNIEHMPAVISQTKFDLLGMFNCNEDKVFNLKFLAIKLGVTQLPNIAVTDTLSNRRFYIVQKNKIFIQENKNTRANVLNRRISTIL